eukprot:TRINITY_DN66434_c0_g1_i1.p1 TRINITY_DN66434_c0_g1~~TRINITY_DN66434_c0_g1_i1.p1  ORF type:complete len:530 (+),score=97.82 TRINITY_DN66434_c0_g1_i1:100-1689(+)
MTYQGAHAMGVSEGMQCDDAVPSMIAEYAGEDVAELRLNGCTDAELANLMHFFQQLAGCDAQPCMVVIWLSGFPPEDGELSMDLVEGVVDAVKSWRSGPTVGIVDGTVGLASTVILNACSMRIADPKSYLLGFNSVLYCATKAKESKLVDFVVPNIYELLDSMRERLQYGPSAYSFPSASAAAAAAASAGHPAADDWLTGVWQPLEAALPGKRQAAQAPLNPPGWAYDGNAFGIGSSQRQAYGQPLQISNLMDTHRAEAPAHPSAFQAFLHEDIATSAAERQLPARAHTQTYTSAPSHSGGCMSACGTSFGDVGTTCPNTFASMNSESFQSDPSSCHFAELPGRQPMPRMMRVPTRGPSGSTGSGYAGKKKPDVRPQEGDTSFMICHLPCRLTEQDIMKAVDSKGFAGKYSYVYLPMGVRCPKGGYSNLGYGFITFYKPEDGYAFAKKFAGYRFAGSNSRKTCTIKRSLIQVDPANQQHSFPAAAASAAKAPQRQEASAAYAAQDDYDDDDAYETMLDLPIDASSFLYQ